MAMRLYSKQEFEAELREKYRLKPTHHHTATTRAWVTEEGDHLLVPSFTDDDRIPDHVIDRVVNEILAFQLSKARR